jgi:predicted transcriptional regulator
MMALCHETRGTLNYTPPHYLCAPGSCHAQGFYGFRCLQMDEVRSLSYSIIFEVLAALSGGPLTIAQVSKACKVQQIYLSTVLSSAISSGLIEHKDDMFQLTKKGARTAIYLLIVNDGMGYKTGDYRALMNALDKALKSDVRV